MKKRCRVYKPNSMQQGGENKSVMTQDSQKDNIPQEKSNNFMKWLHTASNAAQVKQMMEEDMQMLDAGYMQYGGTPMYQRGGPNVGDFIPPNQGNPGDDLGETVSQFDFSNVNDPTDYLAKINQQSTDAGISRSIDKQAFFDQWNTQPQAKNLQYGHPDEDTWSPITQNQPSGNPAATSSFKPQTRYVEPTKDRSGYYEGKMTGDNDNWKAISQNRYFKKYDKNFDQKKYDADPAAYNKQFNAGQSEMQNQYNNAQPVQPPVPAGGPAFASNIPLQQFGGPIMYAQDGASFPGIMPLVPEIDDTAWGDNKHNPYATSAEAFQGFADQEYANPEDDYTNAPEAQTAQMTPGQSDNNQKGKVDRFGMDPRNTNIAQGMISGMKVGTSIGNFLSGKNAEEERRFKAKASDPFRTHGVAGSDRGDYMANVPGIGNNFRPDDHTRAGYNTKMAQDGLAVQDNTRVERPRIPRSRDSYMYNPATNPLTEEELRALAHQERGMSRAFGNTTFVKEDGSIMNSTGTLNNTQNAQLNEYMSQAPWYQALYEGLPNVGRMVGNSAADIPLNSPLQKQQQGGEHQIDEELELSEAEINNLIAQGYNLEYLD